MAHKHHCHRLDTCIDCQAMQVSVSGSLYFDNKFSLIDFMIQKLNWESLGAAEKRSLCQAVVDAKGCNLSLFLRHFRRDFPDVQDMMSRLGLMTLEVREKGKLFQTLRSERGHASERRDFEGAHGPGKSFVHHCRRNFIAQARVRHEEHNGLSPSAKLDASSPPVVADPFLAVLPAPFVAAANDIDRPAATPMDVLRAAPVVALDAVPAAPPRHVPDVANVGPPRGVVGPAAAPVAAAVAPPPRAERCSGKGGSIYMTIKTSKLQAFKHSVGGRTLKADEIEQVTKMARKEREEAEAEGGARWARWVQLYEDEVDERRRGPRSRAVLPPPSSTHAYKPHFAMIGDGQLPVQPKAFCAMYNDKGPPSDERVYKDTRFIIQPEDATYPLRGSALSVGSCCASANNKCRAEIREGLRDPFEIVRAALNRYADSLGTTLANSGEVLIEMSAAMPESDRKTRFFFMLAKASFNPKFQMYVPNRFAASNAQDVSSAELALPFEVEMESALSRIGERPVLAALTADEVSLMLAPIAQNWVVQRLQYTIPDKDTLLFSEVNGLIDSPIDMAQARTRASVRLSKTDLDGLRPSKKVARQTCRQLVAVL